MPKLYDFHYLPSYNWIIEGVTTKSLKSNKKKNVSSIVEHRNNRVAFCNKQVWAAQGGNKIQNTPKLYDFHYLSSYNWIIEGVTTKSFKSNKNKNVSSIVEHRNNRVAFCNKQVWGTPGGTRYKYAKIKGFSLSALVQLDN